MTRVQLEDGIRDLVSTRLGITTIWARKKTTTGASIPRPAGAHAVLNLVSDVSEGLPDGRGDAVLSDGDYLEQVREDRYCRVSVRTYGASAWDKLSDLRLYLRTPTAQGLATAAGLGLTSISDVTDLTELDGAGYEQVGSMDLVFHRRESIEADEGYLETLQIGMTYQDAGGTTIATDTIEAEA